MKKPVFDISNFVDVLSKEKATYNLVERFKMRRKEKKISRIRLSDMSGVSLGSIRRFEETGNISLSSLMSLALALDMLEDFEKLFTQKLPKSLKDL